MLTILRACLYIYILSLLLSRSLFYLIILPSLSFSYFLFCILFFFLSLLYSLSYSLPCSFSYSLSCSLSCSLLLSFVLSFALSLTLSFAFFLLLSFSFSFLLFLSFSLSLLLSFSLSFLSREKERIKREVGSGTVREKRGKRSTNGLQIQTSAGSIC